MTTSRWKRWSAWVFGGVAVLLAGTVAVTSGCASFGAAASGARLERMHQSPHFQEGTFVNEDPTVMNPEGNMGSVMMEFLVGNGEMTVPNCALPLFADVKRVLGQPPASGLRITWLGHSTTLIELDGRRILSDPMWSERASPFTFAGPRRFHPPPLAFEELPSIDAVIISHDHYDHLDMGTVRKLAAKGVLFHVGLGVGAHLERWGVPAAQIRELEWWDEAVLPGDVKIISTPARHFSGRGLFNRNSTLWTSWSLVGPKHRVFFSGDTGLMSNGFDEIRQKLGPFDVSMLEVGQWHRSWGQIHLGPVGALAAHKALGAQQPFPIHWATFELGLHAWSEPAETLVTQAATERVSVITPMLGEPLEPGPGAMTKAWWRELPPIARGCPAGAEKIGAGSGSALGRQLSPNVERDLGTRAAHFPRIEHPFEELQTMTLHRHYFADGRIHTRPALPYAAADRSYPSGPKPKTSTPLPVGDYEFRGLVNGQECRTRMTVISSNEKESQVRIEAPRRFELQLDHDYTPYKGSWVRKLRGEKDRQGDLFDIVVNVSGRTHDGPATIRGSYKVREQTRDGFLRGKAVTREVTFEGVLNVNATPDKNEPRTVVL